MIYALVGRPRSGKSYEAVVFHIIPAIKAGRQVITNIPVNIERIRKVFGDKADLIEVREGKFNDYGAKERPFTHPEDYQTEWRNEQNQGPLFLIDEAHMVLGRQLHNEILYFYSMHGHHGIDIILVTQNLRKIHKDIKDMIEMTYYCVKNTHLGTDKTYTRKNFLGSETKNPVFEETRTYDKNYFPFYQSHTASSSAVTEAQATDTKSVYDTWQYKLGKVFVFGGILYLIVLGFMMFSGDDEGDAASQPTEQTETQPSEANATNERKPAAPRGFGLLEDFEFFVSGWSKQAVFTNTGFDADKSFYRVYVDVYREQRLEFSLKHSDLLQLGYEFKRLSECVYQMSYHGESRIVTCRKAVENKPEEEELIQMPKLL